MSSKPKIYLSSPHLGSQEFEFVREAFATNWIAPLGPHVDAFEREFCERLNHPAEDRGRRAEGGGRTAEGGGRTSDIGNLTSDIGRRSPGALHAAALSSGTAALHLALKLVGLQRGDEVFCSSLTFSASANPIA